MSGSVGCKPSERMAERQHGLVMASVLVALGSTALVAHASAVAGEGVGATSRADRTPSEVESTSVPSIAARHVTYHEPSGTPLGERRIELSPAGMRVRGMGDEAAHEMLQDFSAERAWLIDHERRVVLELPYVEAFDHPEEVPDADDSAAAADAKHAKARTDGKEEAADVAADVADAPDSTGASGAGSSGVADNDYPAARIRGGFLGREPCLDLDVKPDGKGSWRGRDVDVFSCLSSEDGAVEAIEFMDSAFEIVIFRQEASGRIDALEDLRTREYGPAFFEPDSDLRVVEAHDFFVGGPPIGSYREASDPAR